MDQSVALESPHRSVAAVSHSALLRILFGMLQDKQLLEAANRKFNNGSISVVDVTVNPSNTRTIRGVDKPNFLGGQFSSVPDDFIVTLPEYTVVRVNKMRHLPVIQ